MDGIQMTIRCVIIVSYINELLQRNKGEGRIDHWRVLLPSEREWEIERLWI